MALTFASVMKLKEAYQHKLEKELTYEFCLSEDEQEVERLLNIDDGKHRIVFYLPE